MPRQASGYVDNRISTTHAVRKEGLQHAPLSSSSIHSQLRRDICRLDDNGAAAQGAAATLGHVMGGYGAGLYSYLWAEVYAADMFRAAFAEDPMSKTAGRRYREMVLEPGGSRDVMESLKRFLGREPDKEAGHRWGLCVRVAYNLYK